MGQEKRQFVKYNFYQLDPAWRRLPLQERERGRQEFLAVADEFSARLFLRSYSLVGIRGDVDLLLWLVAWELEHIQGFAAQVSKTGLGRYLSIPYSYLAMTHRSPYLGDHRHRGQEGRRVAIKPPKESYPYLVVYPFVKTNEWYQLPRAERQRMMKEHFAIGHKYPTVRINTTYSYGLDDQEHVVVFDTTSLADFQDLVMELREAEARKYTLRDTPIFTCIYQELKDTLESLG